MGKGISNLSYDDLRIEIVDKIADYKELMELYCDKEEVNSKIEFLVGEVRQLINKYIDLRNTLDKYDSNNYDSSMIDVYNDLINNYNRIKNRLNSIINDEKSFLEFFTSSKTSEGYGQGLKYMYGNEQILYKGINEAVSNSVLSTMALKRVKEGKTFELPEENEGEVLIQVVAKDEITNRLSSKEFVGPNLFKYFFMGDGESFHRDMSKLMSDDMLITLDRTVDESVNGKNDSYNVFSTICKEVVAANNILKGSKTY